MNNDTQKLSTEPYRGTRDFYPAEMFVQNYIFSTMKKAVEKYGYVEYDASILERTEVYRAKTGSEIVNEQTYSFVDRGGRDVTIRPEMTPTVARMVAHKRKELSFPLRWYSIPNLMRYERPQRGRLREHWQLNVDLFGIDSLHADAEIIAVARDVMKAFGAQEENFVIRINSRKIINYLVNEYFGLEEGVGYKLTKLIDRKDKMAQDDFVAQIKELVGDNSDKLITFLDCKNISDLPEEFSENDGVQDVKRIEELLKNKGIENYVFDPSLMRGFDYYTGVVFEVFDTDPVNSRSLFGGGRYDDLVGIFGAEKVTGVGFGMGDVTIRDYMETYDLLPEYRSSAQLYICCMSEESGAFADQLAYELRSCGVSVVVDYSYKKVSAQIKMAQKQNIPFIICVGEDEVRTQTFKLKNLDTREEKSVDVEALKRFFIK